MLGFKKNKWIYSIYLPKRGKLTKFYFVWFLIGVKWPKVFVDDKRLQSSQTFGRKTTGYPSALVPVSCFLYYKYVMIIINYCKQ